MRGRGRGWKVAKSDRDRGEVREGKLRLYRRGKGGLMGYGRRRNREWEVERGYKQEEEER